MSEFTIFYFYHYTHFLFDIHFMRGIKMKLKFKKVIILKKKVSQFAFPDIFQNLIKYFSALVENFPFFWSDVY